MRDLRIVFMGTPGFAVGVLQSLVESGANIVGVITAPDKPAGRGRKLRGSAVKEYAVSKNLRLLQPKNLKDENFLFQLRALEANLQIVVAFRMLPKVVWAMPEYGTFNLHASLLPQYRGAAPINWAIMNGESTTGVTTFFIDEKIDTGAIIAKKEISIARDETAGSLHDKLMDLGADLVLETVKMIAEGDVPTEVQSSADQLKEAPKLNNENTRIDWSKPAGEIKAHIRGLDPYPAAWCYLVNGGEELKTKIFGVSWVDCEHEHPEGKLIYDKKNIWVALENGLLEIKELQLPGKRKMKSIDLINGFTFEADAKVV
ncbi:methionyl-tRNA formyltransferase [Pukyongia salina]|uniref:Methionyl-tRNA formyltransferase n=1 Tax=Pukyongia salina TaxID=2094025 RepID=A0A2S0I002_9FLAO|nr:methionyl-tRNA formyltransferase [Pukyongia salina]AVI52154.1 methionyl-tRNA formyltransferase [Pukyongia salina]